MQVTQILGFIGTGIAVVAYAPQIYHLIKRACAQGVSIQTYGLWFVSSILLLIHAVAIRSSVFVFIQIVNVISTAVIFSYSYSLGKKECRCNAVSNKRFFNSNLSVK